MSDTTGTFVSDMSGTFGVIYSRLFPFLLYSYFPKVLYFGFPFTPCAATLQQCHAGDQIENRSGSAQGRDSIP